MANRQNIKASEDMQNKLFSDNDIDFSDYVDNKDGEVNNLPCARKSNKSKLLISKGNVKDEDLSSFNRINRLNSFPIKNLYQNPFNRGDEEVSKEKEDAYYNNSPQFCTPVRSRSHTKQVFKIREKGRKLKKYSSEAKKTGYLFSKDKTSYDILKMLTSDPALAHEE
ncbi:unnamed protein product [Moneuplotes crassus]|uniref:Uncharacterized protein n=1 Tax=Euplotes crassus TaxID=5936 RepID=A0AAD1X9F3_EUPCR|nr:unnamed protein product [Moneuplotes crassus]